MAAEQGYHLAWKNLMLLAAETGADILATAGTPLNTYPNVVWGEDGIFHPAPGYEWASEDTKSLAVVNVSDLAEYSRFADYKFVSADEGGACLGHSTGWTPAMKEALNEAYRSCAKLHILGEGFDFLNCMQTKNWSARGSCYN